VGSSRSIWIKAFLLSSKVFCKKGISTKSLCLNSSLTKINIPIDIELIKPPVIMVIIVAVFFGLNFKILNLALPIFVPSRSPNGAINPPSSIKKVIKIQAKLFHAINTSLLMMNQLNLFARAIGSKTVIFFLSILRRPDSFKSPNNLVIVTLVEPIASAIA